LTLVTPGQVLLPFSATQQYNKHRYLSLRVRYITLNTKSSGRVDTAREAHRCHIEQNMFSGA